MGQYNPYGTKNKSELPDLWWLQTYKYGHRTWQIPDSPHPWFFQLFSREIYANSPRSGTSFHQTPVHPRDIAELGTITPLGLFEYNELIFGLPNANSTFQQFVCKAQGDLNFVFVYIGDIFIASSFPEERLKHLEIVMHCLEKFRLRLNLKICKFGDAQLVFLSHYISHVCFKPLPVRVQ